MQIDLYTKAVLTVIAVALVAIAFRGPAAIAQGSSCGDASYNACYVRGNVSVDGSVTVDGSVHTYQ